MIKAFALFVLLTGFALPLFGILSAVEHSNETGRFIIFEISNLIYCISTLRK